MKKQIFSPLDLDMETIAKLDEAQLNQIVGGANDDDETNGFTACLVGTTCMIQRP